MRVFALSLMTLVSLTLAACGDKGDDGPPMEPEASSELGKEGERVYRSLVDDGNSFTCATCHALTEPATEFRRPGHSLGDAASRPSYKNGQISELREAVNSCLTEWMNAEAWPVEDQRWLALEAFLGEIAPSSAEALSFTVLAAPSAAELVGGDPDNGQASFNASCAGCHGEDGGGTERGLAIAGRPLDPEYIARRVRTSGRGDSSVYDGLTGGVMPFWAADRLSSEELVDIVAWLTANDGTADGPDDGDDGVDDGPDDGMDDGTDDGVDDGPMDDGTDDGTTDGSDDGTSGGNCPSTHAKIGQTAELVEAFHDVGGTAEIIDD